MKCTFEVDRFVSAEIHETLALGIMIECPAADPGVAVLKDIVFIAHGLGLTGERSLYSCALKIAERSRVRLQ